MGTNTKWNSRSTPSQMISKTPTLGCVCTPKSDGVIPYTAYSLTPSSNPQMSSWTPFQCPFSKGPPSTSPRR